MEAMAKEVESGKVDSVFHIGDISYATGFLVEWDYFLSMIQPVSSHVTYMTAIGNHERDYINSGSVYITPDSGGECGVVYEAYFPVPTSAKDKPWYSINQASIHFTIISTEHPWTENSEQYEWIANDLASVDRTKTPWVIFTGEVIGLLQQTQTYVFVLSVGNVDPRFTDAVEPLLLKNKVDLAVWDHVHNYERTCALFQKDCKAMPTKGRDGIDMYDNTNYTAPVHVVIGMAGFKLDKFSENQIHDIWSLSRHTEFVYIRGHATKEELKIEFVISNTGTVGDSFVITKGEKQQSSWSKKLLPDKSLEDIIVCHEL
ncbi:hypothetical protein MKX01_036861 [Papaver californicum]|nr:hypothetical protein MKX01_036861 [Papaver californicum]